MADSDLHGYVRVADTNCEEVSSHRKRFWVMCFCILSFGMLVALRTVSGAHELFMLQDPTTESYPRPFVNGVKNLASVIPGGMGKGLSQFSFRPRLHVSSIGFGGLFQADQVHVEKAQSQLPHAFEWRKKCLHRTRCKSASEEADDGMVTETEDYYEDGIEDFARDDDVLPDSPKDSVIQAANATVQALERNAKKMLVELFIPELMSKQSGPVMGAEGDQQRYWRITQIFAEGIRNATGKRLKVIYPDIGVAAMLKSMWGDDLFAIGSLLDRRPIDDSKDEIAIIACPDFTMSEKVLDLTETATVPVLLFNPRLVSGDIGMGLPVRKKINRFLDRLTQVYILAAFDQPVGGTVFKTYESLWKVFVADPEFEGRYKMISETPARPDGRQLELLLDDYMGSLLESSEGDGSGDTGKFYVGLNRFVRDMSGVFGR